MKRRLLNLLMALSLLPCATATVLSLRGLAAEDMIQYHARGRVVAVQSQRGLIGVITDASKVRGSAWFWEKSRLGENADMVDVFTALYRGTSPAPGFAVVAREPMYVFIAPAWFWLATTGLLASPAAVRVVRFPYSAISNSSVHFDTLDFRCGNGLPHPLRRNSGLDGPSSLGRSHRGRGS